MSKKTNVRSRRGLVVGGGAKKPPQQTPVLVQSPQQPRVFPDTLFSKQKAVLVDLISDGPIKKIHEVFVNEGRAKPKDMELHIRLGTKDQDLLPDLFPAQQELINIGGIEMRHNREIEGPHVQDPDVTRVMVTFRIGGLYRTNDAKNEPADIMPAEIRGQLSLIEISSGKVVSKGSGGWGKPKNFKIEGKTTAGDYMFTRELKIGSEEELGFSHAPPYVVKVVKKTNDIATNEARNDIYLQYQTNIIDERLRYPYSAIVGAVVKSQRFPGIPDRYYDASGLICKVPNNRDSDPESDSYRFYTGDWSGSFIEEWTDNPAWVAYTLIINNRFGLGDWLQDHPPDKWTLYQVGRYCDGLVPSGVKDEDGNDILEPRYTCNTRIEDQEQAIDFIQRFFGAFRTLLYHNGQQLVASCDMPRDRVAIFDPSNVIDGTFGYQYGSITGRHTEYHVRWNDPGYFFMPRFEPVTDEQAIAQYGQNTVQLTPFGCARRGQARRYGKSALEDAKFAGTVAFSTGLEGQRLRPGDRIGTMDPVRNSKRVGGRLLAGEGTEVLLDRDVELTSGHVYLMHIIMPDQEETLTALDTATELEIDKAPLANDPRGVRVWMADESGEFIDELTGEPLHPVEPTGLQLSPLRLKIKPPGTTGLPHQYRVQYAIAVAERIVQTPRPAGQANNRLTLVSPLPETPMLQAVWALEDSTSAEQRIDDWRVLNVNEKDGGTKYEVLGVAYDPSKFDRIDLENVDLDDEWQPTQKAVTLPIPSGIDALLRSRVSSSGLREQYIQLTWNNLDPTDWPTFSHYKVMWAGPGFSELETLKEAIPFGEIDTPPVRGGKYRFAIVAVGVFGDQSAVAYYEFTVGADSPFVLGVIVEGLRTAPEPGVPNDEFIGTDCRLIWSPVTEGAGLIGGYRIRFTTLTGQEIYEEDLGKVTAFTFSYMRNASTLGGPYRQFWFEIAARDVAGQVGPFSRLLVFNRAPELPENIRILEGIRTCWLEGEVEFDLDSSGIIVWGSTDPNFVPGAPKTEIARGPSLPISFPIEAGKITYICWAQYDVFSSDPNLLNVSSKFAAESGTISDPGEIGEGVIHATHLTADEAVIGKSAQIADAVIDSAHIQELTVKTIHIEGSAVTQFSTFLGPNQGTWYNVFPNTTFDHWKVLIDFVVITFGGPISMHLHFGAKLKDILPRIGPPFAVDAFGVEDLPTWPVGVLFGQKQPRIKFRCVRDRSGDSKIVWESERYNIPIATYQNFAIPLPFDLPLAGRHRYTIEIMSEDAIYDEGQASYVDNVRIDMSSDAKIKDFAQRGDQFRWMNDNNDSGPSPWYDIRWVRLTSINRLRLRDATPSINPGAGWWPYQIRNQSYQTWMDNDPEGGEGLMPEENKWPAGYLDMDVRNVKVFFLESKK